MVNTCSVTGTLRIGNVIDPKEKFQRDFKLSISQAWKAGVTADVKPLMELLSNNSNHVTDANLDTLANLFKRLTPEQGIEIATSKYIQDALASFDSGDQGITSLSMALESMKSHTLGDEKAFDGITKVIHDIDVQKLQSEISAAPNTKSEINKKRDSIAYIINVALQKIPEFDDKLNELISTEIVATELPKQGMHPSMAVFYAMRELADVRFNTDKLKWHLFLFANRNSIAA